MPGIGDLAKDAGTKSDVVKKVFSALTARCIKGEVVSIQELGSFKVLDRKATTARNPRTGAKIEVPAQKRLKFQASKTLRHAVNGTKPPPPAPKKAAAPAKA